MTQFLQIFGEERPKGVNECQESEAGIGLEDLRDTKEPSME